MKKGISLTALARTTVDAAHASGRVLMKHYQKRLVVGEKMGAGLVTNADMESEAAALKILRSRFPHFATLTEESSPEPGSSPGRWILDPLDGTTNYVHGFPMFCVSLAAEWNGEIVVGVIYHPVLDDTYIAIRGRGAKVNGQRLRVSKTSLLKDSLLSTGFASRKTDMLHREMMAFERLSGVARAIRRPGSAALDMAYTARGIFDGFWERRLAPWDVAAGYLLVTEAGGKVTDYAGRKFRVDTPEILVSNGILHRQLMKEVRT